jgi:hypothetical protein
MWTSVRRDRGASTIAWTPLLGNSFALFTGLLPRYIGMRGRTERRPAVVA